MSELVDKQVNAQKETLKKTSGVHAKLPQAHEKVCDENERNKQRKKRRAPKILLMTGVYKARTENSCHGYQTASGQRFFIH